VRRLRFLNDFEAAAGFKARYREAGKLRLEGTDYVVHDGDIVHFRFAV
jgi:ribosome-binding ATPase YchF (GTP1/OBG family)